MSLYNPYATQSSYKWKPSTLLQRAYTLLTLLSPLDGRYQIPYIPEGVYAEVRSLSVLRYQAQEALTRVKNRLARWFSIYFPEFRDVYTQPDPVSGIMVLKKAPFPEDIVKLGADGIIKIWREAKLRGAGEKKARQLVDAAVHSIGRKTAHEAARIEMKELLEDYDKYSNRVDELMSLVVGRRYEGSWDDDPGRHGRCAAIAEQGLQ